MPTFDTPEPIAVTLELVVSYLRVTASDRTDTVVHVRPSTEATEIDVKAATQTRIQYADGKLLVKTPKLSGLFGKVGSIDVTIELPSGSHLHGRAAMADLHCEGSLGECGFKTSTGHLQIGHADRPRLNTSAGDITVGHADGHTELTTGTGTVRVSEIDGTAVIKNSNGDCLIGEITGDLRVNAANGNISVERAHAAVGAKTANGTVRVGEVARGSVVLETSLGELEVGIRQGTAARLDLASHFGTVHNSLDAADGPESSDETVEVRARTSYGDILIHRA